MYASATRSGSQVFHASSAACTFCLAVSSVKGGTGGLTSSVIPPSYKSSAIDAAARAAPPGSTAA